MSKEALLKGRAQISAWYTLSRPRCRQSEIASGAKSIPTFFSEFPSCFKIEPVPQPASKISFSRQSGISLASVSKISRCSAPYHQCVSSTQNIVLYSSGCIVSVMAARPASAPIAREQVRVDLKCCHVFLCMAFTVRRCHRRWFFLGTSLHPVANDILRRAGLIQIKAPKIFAE